MQYHSLFRALTYGFMASTVLFSLIPVPLSVQNNVPTVFFNIRAALLLIALTERLGVSASNIVSSYWGSRGTSGNMSRPIQLK